MDAKVLESHAHADTCTQAPGGCSSSPRAGAPFSGDGEPASAHRTDAGWDSALSGPELSS